MITTKQMKKTILFVLILALMTPSISPVFASHFSPVNAPADAGLIPSPASSIRDSENQSQTIEEILSEVSVKEAIADPAQGISDLQNRILKKHAYTFGMATHHEIGHIAAFKTALKLKYPELSDYDLGKNILLALGDREEFIASLPEEKVIEATGYTSAIKTESFFRKSVFGGQAQMSESDFYRETAQKTMFGSYLKLTSTVYKTHPDYALTGRNYFTIRGEAEWVKSPRIQKKDLLVISSTGN